MAATVTHLARFHFGRQLVAWLGLTPLQNSSGGRQDERLRGCEDDVKWWRSGQTRPESNSTSLGGVMARQAEWRLVRGTITASGP